MVCSTGDEFLHSWVWCTDAWSERKFRGQQLSQHSCVSCTCQIFNPSMHLSPVGMCSGKEKSMFVSTWAKQNEEDKTVPRWECLLQTQDVFSLLLVWKMSHSIALLHEIGHLSYSIYLTPMQKKKGKSCSLFEIDTKNVKTTEEFYV